MDSICSICINECSLCFLFSSSSFSLFGRSNLVITNFIHTDTLSPAAGWMDGQTVWYDVEKGRFLVGDNMAKPHVIPVSIYVQFFMSYCVFCYFSAALDIFFNRSIRKTAWSYVQCTIFILSLISFIDWYAEHLRLRLDLVTPFLPIVLPLHSLSVTIFYHRHLQTIKTFKLLDFISVSVTWEFWNSLLLFSRSFSHFIWTTLSILLLVSFFPPWIFISFLKHWRSCSPQLDHSHHRP